MYHEIPNCNDAGTEFCPCKLAETGDCIMCSQLSDNDFCDCVNWKGVCVYQEYVWNGNKAKPGRKEFLSKIAKKEIIKENLIFLSIKLEHSLIVELVKPGSFIFIRNPKSNEFYNTPISLMDVNIDKNLIDICFEIKGTKTKSLSKLEANDNILVKAPFWNGVMGLDNLLSAHNGDSIIVTKGIGQAPMLPVLKQLYKSNNNINLIIDKKPYDEILFLNYLKDYNINITQCDTLDNGLLTDVIKCHLKNLITKKTNLIHCDGPDILNLNLLNYIDSIEDFKNIKYSCANNAKMCCGEGICGTCTNRYKGHVTKKLCKYQTDPKFIFERRRLI